MKTKLIVLGLDGASFELIQPWMDEGTLKNLKKIQQKGTWADMESCLPPVTCPNWKCYATGMNPGKLGAFWWENIDKKEKKVYHPRKFYSKHKEIWDFLSDQKKKVLVMNMPTTYPLKKVNGYLISGGPDSPDEGYTYPKELEKRLEKEGYKVHAEKLNPDIFSREEIFESCKETINNRFKSFKKLIKEDFDFAHLTIFHVNAMQHFYWNDDLTKEIWKILDNHIGDLIKNYNILLMSDHGSNEIKTVFNINTWLENEGYLVLNKSKVSKLFSKLNISQEKCYRLVNKLGIKKELVLKLTPKILLKYMPFEGGEIRKEAKTGNVNWEKSKAIASGQGPVYLIDKSIKDEIKNKLEKVKDKKGKNIAIHIFSKEEIYNGPYLDIAPDLLIDQNKGVHIAGGIGKSGVFESPSKWKGENKKIGLFAVYGNNFKSMGKLTSMKIVDLAPTILSLYGIKKPPEMDGKILDIINKQNLSSHTTPSSTKSKKEGILDNISI